MLFEFQMCAFIYHKLLRFTALKSVHCFSIYWYSSICEFSGGGLGGWCPSYSAMSTWFSNFRCVLFSMCHLFALKSVHCFSNYWYYYIQEFLGGRGAGAPFDSARSGLIRISDFHFFFHMNCHLFDQNRLILYCRVFSMGGGLGPPFDPSKLMCGALELRTMISINFAVYFIKICPILPLWLICPFSISWEGGFGPLLQPLLYYLLSIQFACVPSVVGSYLPLTRSNLDE